MNPKQKAEQAVEAYLEGLDEITLPVYKGVENDTNTDEQATRQQRVVPCITVAIVGDLTEAIPFTGNWQGALEVSVEADKDNTTDADFDTLCRGVFEQLNWDDLKTRLSDAADDFHCLHANIDGVSGRFTAGDNWVNTIRISIVFCESDL